MDRHPPLSCSRLILASIIPLSPSFWPPVDPSRSQEEFLARPVETGPSLSLFPFSPSPLSCRHPLFCPPGPSLLSRVFSPRADEQLPLSLPPPLYRPVGLICAAAAPRPPALEVCFPSVVSPPSAPACIRFFHSLRDQTRFLPFLRFRSSFQASRHSLVSRQHSNAYNIISFPCSCLRGGLSGGSAEAGQLAGQHQTTSGVCQI
ncbi:hypothetical protein GGR56DRAFT_644443 [Xylariaceae sp. FL0804]|nr:hypothetical protein GGR56DRAFT_644443 [Xylariaceae sp. FL0804]